MNPSNEFWNCSYFLFNCTLVEKSKSLHKTTWTSCAKKGKEKREGRELYVVSKVARNEDDATQDDF